MFYILLQNVPPVDGDDGEMMPSGFLSILLNSYRFALGDFNILSYFETQANPFMFWFIFVISTLIQILIMLNMLIAVMTTPSPSTRRCDHGRERRSLCSS